MKRILSITFLNFFISGGLTLVIPLLLLERNVDLVEIGLVLSVLPLVFLIMRIFIALIADLKGWNRLYVILNWPGNFFAVLTYLVANSTFLFLFGKIFEAVKESSYWAVNRTAIFSLNPGREEKEATRNTAVLFLSTALGSVMAGIGIAYLGFSLTLVIFITVASVVGFPASSLWKISKQNLRSNSGGVRNLVHFRTYGRTFWFVSITLLFFSLAFYPLLNLLLPVFMAQQLGYNYITIGIAYMLFNFIASAIIFGSLHFKLGIKRAILQCIFALMATSLLAFSDFYFIAFFLILAIAEGLGMGFFESIIAKATKNKTSVSLDIGLLHVPMRLAEFASLLYAGFIAQSTGFFPIFLASGAFFTIFSILALSLLKH